MVGRFAILTGTIALLLSAGCAVNPVTGDEELMLFSPEKDVELGQKYAPLIEKALGGRLANENLQRYVDRIGQRMARVCQRPDIAYYFTVVDHESVNAFAVPGGYVFITRGLLEKLESEGQLAAILGHEVAHIVARDTMVALSQKLGMGALVAASAAVGGAGSNDLLIGTAFISSVLTLEYSRADEKAADLAGMSYMTQAGYDPNGAVETMRVLEELQTMRPIEFFSTHPNPENRVVYLEDRIERRYRMLGELKIGVEDYQQNVLAVLAESKPGRRPSKETAKPGNSIGRPLRGRPAHD